MSFYRLTMEYDSSFINWIRSIVPCMQTLAPAASDTRLACARFSWAIGLWRRAIDGSNASKERARVRPAWLGPATSISRSSASRASGLLAIDALDAASSERASARPTRRRPSGPGGLAWRGAARSAPPNRPS
jgi:hypothetical protein